jgi:hypothetical protein
MTHWGVTTNPSVIPTKVGIHLKIPMGPGLRRDDALEHHLRLDDALGRHHKPFRHPDEGRDPSEDSGWVPAFAGMTH